MRDAGVVEPVSRGVYRLASLEPLAHPDLVTVAKRVPLGVLCLVSALSFHELTTQVPHAIDVALKRGTRMPRLDYRPTRFFWFSGPAFYEGIETDGAISGGHKVTAPKGAAASTLTRLRNVADAAGVSFNEIHVAARPWTSTCSNAARPIRPVSSISSGSDPRWTAPATPAATAVPPR